MLRAGRIRVVIAETAGSWQARCCELLAACGDMQVTSRVQDRIGLRVAVRMDAPHVVVVLGPLPGLRSDLIADCHAAGCAVVLVAAGAGSAWGADRILAADGAGDDLVAAVRDLGSGHSSEARHVTHQGPVVAVTGPVGSPGRSALALALAARAARNGDALLVDADAESPALAAWLGMPAPSVADALGGTDAVRAGIRPVAPGLSLAVIGQCPLDAATAPGTHLREVLAIGARDHHVVVVDAGPVRAEPDLLPDGLAASDHVVVVSGPDPLSVARFLAVVAPLVCADTGGLTVVVNRVRHTLAAVDYLAGHIASLGVPGGVIEMPDLPAVFDRSLMAGRPPEFRPRGPERAARKALDAVLLRVARPARRSLGA